ncbi:hypothetical protein D1839_06070 [Roseburia sp. 1XD42-34]|nr:hypothetical protein [Roseburia sp. 1XD42-34]RKI79940.1 hypothetical protein D7V87_06060 [Clostridium sp. 1xD42-85]
MDSTQGYDLKAFERIGDLGAVTSCFDLLTSPILRPWESTTPFYGIKEFISLKQGYTDVWEASPFFSLSSS